MKNKILICVAVLGCLAAGVASSFAQDIDYLIITSEAYSNAFQRLADYRTEHNGFSTKIVTLEYIAANYDGTKPSGGSDLQTKARNCIKEYAASNNTYIVVIGGNSSDLDGRRYTHPHDGSVRSDHYYACLERTWDDDADGEYNEGFADADQYPDVWVGRISVTNNGDISNYVQKVITYETVSRPEIYNKVLLGGNTIFDVYTGDDRPTDIMNDGYPEFRAANHPSVSDVEIWNRIYYRDYIKSSFFTTNKTSLNYLFNTLTSWDTTTCGDYAANVDNLVQRMNEGWNYMMFDAHGSTTRGGWITEGGRTSPTVIEEGVTNNVNFIYTLACVTAQFWGYSQAESFIRRPVGGALVYIGCGPSNYGGVGQRYQDSWYDYVFVQKNRYSGEAFFNHKLDRAGSGDNIYWRAVGAGLNHHGDPALALITDEPNFVSISVSNAVIAEAGAQSGLITISRTLTQGAQDINYQLSGSATYAGDYTSAYSITSGVASFADGVAIVQIDVDPVNDSDIETNENVVITLPVGTNYFLVGGGSAAVTIVDDDNATLPEFSLSIIDGQAVEGGDTAMLELVRAANSSGSITVNLAHTGGTAAIADYNNGDISSVVFADAEMSVLVEIIPTDDVFVEGTEWLELSITADASYTIGTASNVTVDIIDDEAPHNVTITVPDGTADEEASDPAVVRITRDGNNSLDLDVSYIVDAGTTVITSDYNYVDFTGTVTIPGGSDYVDLTLVPVDDAVPEVTEKLDLSFVTNNNYYVISGSPAVSLTVLDNDAHAPVANLDYYVVSRDNMLNVSAPGVLENDTDLNLDPLTAVLETTTANGTLSLTNDGSFAYTPDLGFMGLDTFTYKAYDGGLYSSVATVSVQVVYPPDFKVHRGTFDMPMGGMVVTTLVNGVDYTLDSGATMSNAFIKLVNASHGGGGDTNSGDARDALAWIDNPTNLITSVDIRRLRSSGGGTKISWEILEYVGESGGANEIIVRDQASMNPPNALSITGAVCSSISDTNRVIVYVTGQSEKKGGNSIAAAYHTASLDSAKRPVFARETLGNGSRISYAIVEFAGTNWSDVQRVEQYIVSVNTDYPQAIDAVNTNRAFMHMQTRGGHQYELGAQAWFSATNEVTFRVNDAGGALDVVAWIVENTEDDPEYAMKVQHVRNTRAAGVGTAPDTWTETISAVTAMDNSSIMGECGRTASNWDYAYINFVLTSLDTVTLYRRINDEPSSYAFSVVEWPKTGSGGGGPADSDGDGMPDSWEDAYGLNSSSNDAAGDADGDGMSNLAEYYAGTAPDDTNSIFRIIKHSGHDANEFGSLVQALSSGAEIKLMWLGGTNGSTNDYIIYRSTSLVDAAWGQVTNYPRTNASGTNVWVDTEVSNDWLNIFYKITAPTN
ncbi:C25 family cysteine peptidase [Verrucomicrobiota bacterium]